MEKKELKAMSKLIAMVLSYNNKFGTYPTVFVRYSGHVNWVDIDVHDAGWSRERPDTDKHWTVNEVSDLTIHHAEIKAYLDAIK